MQEVMHEIEPVYDGESRVLVLGSFPSVTSREGGFFYHHPQNRFWKVLADLLKEPVPSSIEDKKTFLLKNQIAVWDVIKKCEINGSSDGSIRSVTPNDLSRILMKAPIVQIFTNGNKAHELYGKYCRTKTGRTDVKLPSTSPANASYSLERLILCWKPLEEALRGVSVNAF